MGKCLEKALGGSVRPGDANRQIVIQWAELTGSPSAMTNVSKRCLRQWILKGCIQITDSEGEFAALCLCFLGLGYVGGRGALREGQKQAAAGAGFTLQTRGLKGKGVLGKGCQALIFKHQPSRWTADLFVLLLFPSFVELVVFHCSWRDGYMTSGKLLTSFTSVFSTVQWR